MCNMSETAKNDLKGSRSSQVIVLYKSIYITLRSSCVSYEVLACSHLCHFS